MNKKLLLGATLFVVISIGAFLLLSKPAQSPVTPSGDETPVGTENKSDLIRDINIESGDFIESPLVITGEARGYWYFEASFPIVLVNWDGLIIASGFATAQDEWMTEDFVPFESTLEFTKPSYGENGALILQKDNPSDLPEFDDALEIPIKFK